MTERKLAKNAARRLAIIRYAQEVTGNVSLTCRYYGISTHCYYKWLRRFEAEGEDGLRDRSPRPKTSPKATKTVDITDLIARAPARQSSRGQPGPLDTESLDLEAVNVGHGPPWHSKLRTCPSRFFRGRTA